MKRSTDKNVYERDRSPASGKNSELVVIILIIILSIVGAISTVSTIYSKLESVEEYQAQEEAPMMMEDTLQNESSKTKMSNCEKTRSFTK